MYELNRDQFITTMKTLWKQGQHAVILGPTGSGKTYLAADMVAIRSYVAVLAVKKHDDTLDQFRKRGFKVLKKWPPEYNEHHVVLWLKPENLSQSERQRAEIRAALDKMYQAGGWCIYFDEAGYISGHLKLGQELGVLLNQGRSSHISVVCTMTRPHSVVGQVPLETLNQARHIIIFKYTDEREIKSCSQIAGISYRDMLDYMKRLASHDFLYFGPDGFGAIVGSN